MGGEGSNGVSLEARIALFDHDGSLAADCRDIASLFANDAVRVAKRFWTHFGAAPDVATPFEGEQLDELVLKILPYLAAKYATPAARNGRMVKAYVEDATAANISLTTLISSISAAAAEGHIILIEKIGDDPERLSRLARCLTQATLLEADVFAAHFDRLRARAERESRAARGAQFNEEIVSVVERTASDSQLLRAQAAEASAAARGMLGKTSEVAAPPAVGDGDARGGADAPD